MCVQLDVFCPTLGHTWLHDARLQVRFSAQDFAGTDGGSAQGAGEVLGGLGFWVRASNQKKVHWWIIDNLVGGLEDFLFFHMLGIVISTD